MPARELSEKEITLMNTERNAGNSNRRNSSNPRSSISRRQSSQSATSEQAVEGESDGMRLKWDEANLYLNEGQMGGRMKIDEPKTPYAKNYDPAEDEDEISTLNAQELAVDELEMNKAGTGVRKNSGSRAKDNEIPDIDIGQPELEPLSRADSDSERRVQVASETSHENGSHHGEEDTSGMSQEEQEKHKKFENMRKKHYEMKNIKSLLGYVVLDLTSIEITDTYPDIPRNLTQWRKTRTSVGDVSMNRFSKVLHSALKRVAQHGVRWVVVCSI